MRRFVRGLTIMSTLAVAYFLLPTTVATAVGALQISGTITTAESQPVSGATVTDGSHTTSTNSAGQYNFQELQTGSYPITATASGFASQTATAVLSVTSPDATQNFTLRYISSSSATPSDISTANGPASITYTLTTSTPDPGSSGQAGFSCGYVVDSLSGSKSAMTLGDTSDDQTTWTYVDNLAQNSAQGPETLTGDIQDCSSGVQLDIGAVSAYTINNTGPVINDALIGPSDGGHTVFTNQPLFASVSDNLSGVNPSSIQFTLLDTTTGVTAVYPAATYSSPWAVTAPVALTGGDTYKITVAATDYAGNQSSMSQTSGFVVTYVTPSSTSASIPPTSCTISGSNGVTATATCPDVRVSLSATSASIGPIQADETTGYVQQTVPLSGAEIGTTIAGKPVNVTAYQANSTEWQPKLTSMLFTVANPGTTPSTTAVPAGKFDIGTLTATVPATWSSATLSMPATGTTATMPTCADPVNASPAFSCYPDPLQNGYRVMLKPGASGESSMQTELSHYNLSLIQDETGNLPPTYYAHVPPQEIPTLSEVNDITSSTRLGNYTWFIPSSGAVCSGGDALEESIGAWVQQNQPAVWAATPAAGQLTLDNVFPGTVCEQGYYSQAYIESNGTMTADGTQGAATPDGVPGETEYGNFTTTNFGECAPVNDQGQTLGTLQYPGCVGAFTTDETSYKSYDTTFVIYEQDVMEADIYYRGSNWRWSPTLDSFHDNNNNSWGLSIGYYQGPGAGCSGCPWYTWGTEASGTGEYQWAEWSPTVSSNYFGEEAHIGYLANLLGTVVVNGQTGESNNNPCFFTDYNVESASPNNAGWCTSPS